MVGVVRMGEQFYDVRWLFLFHLKMAQFGGSKTELCRTAYLGLLKLFVFVG